MNNSGKVLFFCYLVSLLSGCAGIESSEPSKLERRNVEEYYIGSGIIKYFLPQIPMWANFSRSGNCMKSKSVKYVDLKKLRGSFDLTYHQALQFQYQFNKESEMAQTEAAAKYLPFQDEEKLFYYVSDKVQSEIFSFRVPTYSQVNLVWMDEALKDKASLARFKRLMNSTAMDKGHPVLLSLCLTYIEMEKFLKENHFQNRNIRLLSYEMLSPYNAQNELTPGITIDFKEVFKKSQKLYMFVPKGREVPANYKGDYAKINTY